MIMKDLITVLFGHPHGLLFCISLSGKGTFYDEILFKLAISLLSSSNTWYLREGERNKMRVFVKSWGQRPPSTYGRRSQLLGLRLHEVEGGIHNDVEKTLLNFQSSL
jgi:hypothetical protein